MEKLYANYHGHSYLCGHAVGSDEEMVQAAIKLGLKVMGFSDHISLPNYPMPGMRADYSLQPTYFESVNSLKDKYRDQIEIHLGYEAEWLPQYKDYYEDLIKSKKVEYLILGQHMYLNEYGHHVWYNSSYHDNKTLAKYVDDVIEGMKTGLFKYVAHPDHAMNGYRIWDEFAIKQFTRLIETAEELQIPLEINVAGLRFAEYKHRKNGKGQPVENMYPYPAFWDLVSKYNIDCIIGIDAHSPNDYLDGIEQEAITFAHDHHLKLIDRLDL